MIKVAMFVVAIGCVGDLSPAGSGDGVVFRCVDQHGVEAKLCYDGPASDIEDVTTWTCEPSTDIADRAFGCDYRCPSGRDWWSWCP